MNIKLACGLGSLAAVAVSVSQVAVHALPDARSVRTAKTDVHPGDGPLITPAAANQGLIGPDVKVVVVGYQNAPDLINFRTYGPVGDYIAYGVATTSCNIGDVELSWRDGTQEAPDNRHPVISQNMYRLKDGRFEHIGQSWLKHAFCALDDTLCGACMTNSNCDFLGIGCSDPYSAGLNASQTSHVGPKYQVNAYTGDFPYPPDTSASVDDATSRRLRVHVSDVIAAENPGARYFLEAQYVAADDAAAGNEYNNASYREAVLNSDGSIMAWVGAAPNTTVQETPAIYAWQASVPGVEIVEANVPAEGRFYVGYNVTDLGSNQWAYEYAVFNFNSDIAARAFSVPALDGLNITDIGFHDVDYHSGEPFDGTDWPDTFDNDEVLWQTDTFVRNPNANALRFATMYNFRFVADSPPREAVVQLSLFKDESTLAVPAVGPTPAEDVNADGSVDIFDLLDVLTVWGACEEPCPPHCPADVDNSCAIDVFDMLAILEAWGL